MVPASPPAEARAKKALDDYFRGRVLAVDAEKGRVTLRYDFGDKEQLKDWEDGAPFRVFGETDATMRWFDGHLDVPKKKGARHKAVWMGDVTVTATLRFSAFQDIGVWFAPSDGANDYVIYTLAEHYFHKWNGKAGGQHSIIQFGDQWREGDSGGDFTGFRYISRRPKRADPAAGEAVTIECKWSKGQFWMEGPDDLSLKGKPKGPPLESMHVGFYTVEGKLRVDEVTIEGTLDPTWMTQAGVELRVARDADSGELDPETLALVTEHQGGRAKATRALIRKLRDTGQPEATRDALLAALSAGPKRTVSSALDLLYDPDVQVRTYGIAIIKAHLGKNYGFKPKASEKRRTASIKKLTTALAKNPALLEG